MLFSEKSRDPIYTTMYLFELREVSALRWIYIWRYYFPNLVTIANSARNRIEFYWKLTLQLSYMHVVTWPNQIHYAPSWLEIHTHSFVYCLSFLCFYHFNPLWSSLLLRFIFVRIAGSWFWNWWLIYFHMLWTWMLWHVFIHQSTENICKLFVVLVVYDKYLQKNPNPPSIFLSKHIELCDVTSVDCENGKLITKNSLSNHVDYLNYPWNLEARVIYLSPIKRSRLPCNPTRRINKG